MSIDADEADDTLLELASAVAPLEITASTQRAYESFSADPSLYALAVVDDAGAPIGIINRFKFLETLSRPFGRDLLTHRTVAAVMDGTPLIVDERVPLDQLSDILVDDSSKYIFDGFIVTRHGKYVGIGTGYTLMRRLTERRHRVLFHLAHHDSLTGLPNRQLFGDRLAQALAQAGRKKHQLGVLFIDLDRFKAVNDGGGHALGDQLLKEVARRLQQATRAEDTVARLSGDEFAMVLPNLGAADHAAVVADKLLRALREPHHLEGQEINVSCSIGIAIFPDDGRTDKALLRSADDALYHAKQFRNTYQRFAADMQRTDQGPLLSFSAVRRAVESQHLEVHYQPQVSTKTRRLSGLEALVRWHDPVCGPGSTPQFIRAAEDAGLIASVSDFVVREAMRQLLMCARPGHAEEVTLAINVSAVEVRSGALIPMLERHLADTGFPPSALELEITENTVMFSDASTMAVVKELKRLGIRLSVDDFGVGHSSLSRFQTLPIDGVKIDRTFIRGVGHGDRSNEAIVEAVIAMAHARSLLVTAEGVETPEQLAFLEAHGCDRLQGYLISRPLPPAALVEYLAGATQP